MRVLDTKISRSSSEQDQMALASAEDDSLGRPVQLLGPGRTGQNLAEHIERSEAPEDKVRCLASKVQEQDGLHVSKLVLCFFSLDLFAWGVTHIKDLARRLDRGDGAGHFGLVFQDTKNTGNGEERTEITKSWHSIDIGW